MSPQAHICGRKSPSDADGISSCEHWPYFWVTAASMISQLSQEPVAERGWWLNPTMTAALTRWTGTVAAVRAVSVSNSHWVCTIWTPVLHVVCSRFFSLFWCSHVSSWCQWTWLWNGFDELAQHFVVTHRVTWRHGDYGHDTIAILWV